jgi:hypothetical protein
MGKTYFEQVPLEVVKRIMATDPEQSGAGAACTICGKQVRYEDSKTDERGRPVHENCYVTSLPRLSRQVSRA